MTVRLARQAGFRLLALPVPAAGRECTGHGRLRDDPALSPDMPTLSDMRAVTRVDITSEGFRGMLARMSRTETCRGIAKAAIVTSGEAAFGMARMLSGLGEANQATPNFRTFRDMAEARAWLGLAGSTCPEIDQ